MLNILVQLRKVRRASVIAALVSQFVARDLATDAPGVNVQPKTVLVHAIIEFGNRYLTFHLAARFLK